MLDFNCLERHTDASAKIDDRRRAYSAMELTELCTDFIKAPYDKWDAGRKQALSDLKEWYTAWDDMCEDWGQLVPEGTDMMKAISLISKIFFDGRLDHVQFKWETLVQELVNGKPKGDIIYATTSIPDEDDNSDENRPKIRQDARIRNHTDPLYDHRAAIFDTLLHECVHAYLGTYACGSETCECESKTTRDVGKTGHGPTFFLITTHIAALFEEDAIDWRFLKPPMSLDYSLEQENRETGNVLRNEDIEKCAPSFQEHLRGIMRRQLTAREHSSDSE
ncbi:hypothetical protein CBER1_04980 [Cercospora berteroae]|uniref:Uncharacterized protein n=1 Tax=Cercospora berteroae TaxID=357750 RepID=A0A2S6BQY9_9PEZI|nr:hypothetical protein CBER1_04980 [Cercospora berteroae]